MTKTRASSVAFGKLIINGEHAVVFDRPALAVPINTLQTKAYISANDQEGIYLKSRYFFGNLNDCQNILPSLYALIKDFLSYIEQTDANFQVNIESSIPEASGLGSSAAVSWSLTNALNNYFGCNLSKEELFNLASVSERIIHTNPSGLDLMTSSSNVPIIFQKNKETLKLNLASKLNGFIVIATTPKQGITKNAVKQVAKNAQAHPLMYEQYFNEIEEITYQAISHFQRGNIRALGNDLNANQKILEKMQLSTKKIEELLRLAEQHNSLGAKITGSGLGGSIFALMEDYESSAMLEADFKRQNVNFTHIIDLSGFNN